jgi:hypothetical protein
MVQPDTSFGLKDKKGNPVSVNMKIDLSLVSESTPAPQDGPHLPITELPVAVVQPDTGVQPAKAVGGLPNVAPQDNIYLALAPPAGVVVDSETKVARAKAVGSVAYEGLKTVVDGLYDCSDMFLPLKTAAGVFRTITKIVEVCVLDLAVHHGFQHLFLPIRPCRRIRRNSKILKQSCKLSS